MKRAGLLAALIGVCVVLTVLLLFFLPVFRITDIQVRGNELVSEDVIRSTAQENNSNIFAFNKPQTIKKLEKNNYIEDVKIEKQLPRTLVITVTERKIRGYAEYTGNYLCLSDNGLVIDVKSEITYPAPIITGLKFDTFTVGEYLEVDNPRAFESMNELSLLFSKYQLLNNILKVDISDPKNIRFYCGNVQVIYGESDGSTGRMLTLIEILKTLDTTVPGTLDLTLENPTFTYTY
ncbi:MAG: FtsQ-type POTRA domain-containing protein [Firmicutes bacterium]|nr:FtsQ-type POTRA domain-containing protein [Bacillota bacterium]MBQ9604529.1 FtsQ-type POTRA domain-containing protein [Bacillota bacterium]